MISIPSLLPTIFLYKNAHHFAVGYPFQLPQGSILALRLFVCLFSLLKTLYVTMMPSSRKEATLFTFHNTHHRYFVHFIELDNFCR